MTRTELLQAVFDRVCSLSQYGISHNQHIDGSELAKYPSMKQAFHIGLGGHFYVKCCDGKILDYDEPKLAGMQLYVDGYPNGYGGAEHDYSLFTKADEKHSDKYGTIYKHPISDEQLSAIADFYDQVIADRKEEIAKTMTNKPLAEIQDQFLAIIKNLTTTYNKNYVAEVSKGHRQSDYPNTSDYEVIVIYDKSYGFYHGQIGTIRFSQDEFGRYYAGVRAPLSGGYTEEFDESGAEKTLRNAVYYLTH